MAKEYELQLTDIVTGRTIYHGGSFVVVPAGGTTKVAITDTDDVAITQPGAVVSGGITFRTPETVESVDIYGLTDQGYPFQVFGAKAGDRTELRIDLSRLDHVIMLPYDVNDSDITANTEYDTGFNFSGKELVLYDGIGTRVIEADAGITLDVGTGGSGSDDPDGLLDGISLAATGFVLGTVGFTVGASAAYVDLTGGDQEYTIGALLAGTGTKAAIAEGSNTNTDEGFFLLEPYVGQADDDITLTISSGADTAAGIAFIPIRLHTLAGA